MKRTRPNSVFATSLQTIHHQLDRGRVIVQGARRQKDKAIPLYVMTNDVTVSYRYGIFRNTADEGLTLSVIEARGVCRKRRDYVVMHTSLRPPGYQNLLTTG